MHLLLLFASSVDPLPPSPTPAIPQPKKARVLSPAASPHAMSLEQRQTQLEDLAASAAEDLAVAGGGTGSSSTVAAEVAAGSAAAEGVVAEVAAGSAAADAEAAEDAEAGATYKWRD